MPVWLPAPGEKFVLRALKAGKGIAGLGSGGGKALRALREDVSWLPASTEKLLSAANRSGRLLITEKGYRKRWPTGFGRCKLTTAACAVSLAFFSDCCLPVGMKLPPFAVRSSQFAAEAASAGDSAGKRRPVVSTLV